MKLNYKKAIIILGLVFLFSTFTFSLLNKKKSLNYWELNDCPRGIPEAIINQNQVANYSFIVNKEAGIGLENLILENYQYSIGQIGCSNFDLKILLPIGQENNSFVREDIILHLNNLKNISFSPYIFNDLIKNINSIDKFEYNLRNYTCLEGDCRIYTVLLEPVFWENEYFLPIKITYLL